MSDTPTDTDPNRTTAGRTDRRNTLDTDAIQWLSALVAIIGLSVVASPFLFEGTEQAIWNDALVGTGIFLLAGHNFVRLSRDRLAGVAVASLTALLGLWLLASPVVIDASSAALATGTAASGLAVAALSAYNAYANNRADSPDRAGVRV